MKLKLIFTHWLNITHHANRDKLRIFSLKSSLKSVLNTATKGYRFSIFGWEVTSIFSEIKQTWEDRNVSVNDTQTVVDYFNALQQNSLDPSEVTGLRNKVESIIELQIRSVLNRTELLTHSVQFLELVFPPIDFKLAEPPHLLVISPRNQIARIRDFLLLQNMTTEQMNNIENR